MGVELVALRVGARDPEGLARFWGGLLDRYIAEDGVTLLPSDEVGFLLQFEPLGSPKVGPNWMHLHLTSGSWEEQRTTVERALALDGRHLDVGQDPEEEHVVLADPEGNEFCVIPPGNSFLADCGFLGELTCDGSREVGHFWSEALGWPLVWDQDEETAIQSPRGGAKISWGGPPLAPRTGRNRLHLHVAPQVGGDLAVELQRLVDLGASRRPDGHHDVGLLGMTDPDGNPFCVVARPSEPAGPFA